MDWYRTRKEGTYTDDACMTNTVVYTGLSPALSVWPSAIITALAIVLWICHNVDSAVSQWSYQYVVLHTINPRLETSPISGPPCIKSSWLWSTWIVVMYSYRVTPSLVCHWLLPYLPLYPPSTTSMSSLVCFSALPCLSLCVPLSVSVCTLTYWTVWAEHCALCYR